MRLGKIAEDATAQDSVAQDHSTHTGEVEPPAFHVVGQDNATQTDDDNSTVMTETNSTQTGFFYLHYDIATIAEIAMGMATTTATPRRIDVPA